MKYAVGIFLSLIIMQLILPYSIIDAIPIEHETTLTQSDADTTAHDAVQTMALPVDTESDTAPQVTMQTENANEPEPFMLNLLDTETMTVSQIPLEDYLVCVVFAEMPASFEEEALKAQAVAARSYTMFKLLSAASGGTHKHGADICTSYAHCSAYMTREQAADKWGEDYIAPLWDKVASCVKATAGVIMTYKGQPVNAVFHAMSVGMTESSVDLWGGDVEYLSSVSSPENEKSDIKDVVTTLILTPKEFSSKLRSNGYRGSFELLPESWIGALELTGSGRVKSIEIGGIKLSGARMREIFGLRSAMFALSYNDGNFKFTVRGYGHGVGMSQQGANLLAKDGADYRSILEHYYTGVDVVSDAE